MTDAELRFLDAASSFCTTQAELEVVDAFKAGRYPIRPAVDIGSYAAKIPRRQRPVYEGDIRLTKKSKLCLKVLVFPNRKALRQFWRKTPVSWVDVGRGCAGVVTALAESSWEIREECVSAERMACDPNYYAAMGLVLGWLNMEIICHEATHAAMEYVKRTGRRGVFAAPVDLSSEEVAYPAGVIAAAVNRILHTNGLYERKEE